MSPGQQVGSGLPGEGEPHGKPRPTSLKTNMVPRGEAATLGVRARPWGALRAHERQPARDRGSGSCPGRVGLSGRGAAAAETAQRVRVPAAPNACPGLGDSAV